MSEPSFIIRYEFSHAEKTSTFTITLDPKTLQNTSPAPVPPPAWAKLSFQKCPNCPLREEDSPHCPAALGLTDVVAQFADIFSYERVSARVTVPERVYEQVDVSVQEALSSLLGVYMVTSGCPVLSKLRPMVRFHLPFQTELETITRATSMYLLGQYLVAQDGGTPDWSLAGLSSNYEATSVVNRAFAARLRAAAPKDANVNALIRLDSVARSVPDLIDSQMDELRFLFGK
ncbi:MAG: hypothetical protein Q8N23_08875 [Archangium sp.]|nr:hypothetical protein [Archangium sp.]MDP3573557.1 hypothetical protein [Archangium sp.]